MGIATVINHEGQFAVVLYHEVGDVEIQPQGYDLNYVSALARGRAKLWGYRFVEPKCVPTARPVQVPFAFHPNTDHESTVNIRKVG